MKFVQGKILASYLPIGAVLVAILALWFGLLPGFRRLSDTQSQISGLAAEITAKNRELETLRKLLGQGQVGTSTLNLLSLAAPSEPQIPELLVMVQAMASRAGLSLVNATPSASPGGTKMDITLRGSYGGVVSFLDTLNRNLRPGVVQNFSIISENNPADGETAAASTVASVSVEFIGQAGEEVTP